jgi:flagella basal body P-ring formation protein FlgA
MRITKLLWFVSLLIPPVFSQQAQAASSVPIKKAVDDFLVRQIKGLPGKASYTIGPIDAGHLADNCNGYDVFMAAGARPWGNTYLSVTCGGGNWSLRVPVKIQVVADYLVSARPLMAGKPITEDDLGRQSGELSVLPNGILTDKELAIGRVLVASLPAGRPLRGDMLRQQMVVQQGQNIRIVTVGNGFQVSGEGRALSNAAIGQVTQVRLNSGQVLSGIVRADGSIEIKP